MKQLFLTISLSLMCFHGFAQYTETINSNRPGASQGAFSVGHKVIQFEMGGLYEQNQHDLTQIDATQWGVDYEFRFGIIMEQLELNLKGRYLSTTEEYIQGGQNIENKYRNFQSNTLAIKYLVYDPYKKRAFEKPNIYSWKANNSFQWRDLIPAVSIYAGANILLGDNNPYLAPGVGKLTPTAALVTQNNWGKWVFVMNFIADRFTSDDPFYSGIFTMTHTLNAQFSVFAEYQAIKNDFYADDLVRLGGAYLFSKDLQLDLYGLTNFKDTPSRWQVGLGISYRLDNKHEDEIIMEKKQPKQKKNKKVKNSELVDPESELD